MDEFFRRLATKIAKLTGSVWSFAFAICLVLVWAGSGPFLDYSNTWQLMINTSTTIITFTMVFIIQNTQNRDSKAIHLKLDELIQSVKGASLKMVDVENVSNAELEELLLQFKQKHDRYQQALEKRQKLSKSVAKKPGN